MGTPEGSETPLDANQEGKTPAIVGQKSLVQEAEESPEFQEYVGRILTHLENLSTLLDPQALIPGSGQLSTLLNHNITGITAFLRVIDQVTPEEYQAIAQKTREAEDKMSVALGICQAEQSKYEQNLGGKYVYPDTFSMMEREWPSVKRSLMKLDKNANQEEKRPVAAVQKSPVQEAEKSPEFQEYVGRILTHLENLNELLNPQTLIPESSLLPPNLNHNITGITAFLQFIDQVTPGEYRAITQKTREVEDKMSVALQRCQTERLGGKQVYPGTFSMMEGEWPSVRKSLIELEKKVKQSIPS